MKVVKIVLVTGSRKWTDQDVVWGALQEHFGDQLIGIVRHGHCPTGVDAMADAWCELQPGMAVDRMPASWATLGKKAGPRRNLQMVRLPTTIVLAFPLGESRGTRDCMAKATAQGLRVVNYGEE
jgi:hypothetical protein